MYPDRACKRTVLSLTVKCYNSGNECDWTGELLYLPVSIIYWWIKLSLVNGDDDDKDVFRFVT